MKYIIFQMREFEVPVAVPDFVIHKHVNTREPIEGMGARPIAAGFYSVDSSMNVTCRGKSESLHLESRGEKDAKLIRDHLFLGINVMHQ